MRWLLAATALSAIAITGLAVVLSTHGPASAAIATACPTGTDTTTPTASPAQPTPTLAPSTHIRVCNGTDDYLGGLQMWIVGPMYMSATVEVNPSLCSTPDIEVSESTPDFTNHVTVSWAKPCVAPHDIIQVAIFCNDPGYQSCGDLVPDCLYWLIGERVIGQPCEPPNCGTQCCSGVPCPTPTQPFADQDFDYVGDDTDNCDDVPNLSQRDGDGDGIGDMCDLPNGDVTCDFLVTTEDIRSVLGSLESTETPASCTAIQQSLSRSRFDLDCDQLADVRDLLPILRYFADLSTGSESCPAIST